MLSYLYSHSSSPVGKKEALKEHDDLLAGRDKFYGLCLTPIFSKTRFF